MQGMQEGREEGNTPLLQPATPAQVVHHRARDEEIDKRRGGEGGDDGPLQKGGLNK